MEEERWKSAKIKRRQDVYEEITKWLKQLLIRNMTVVEFCDKLRELLEKILNY